MNYGRTSLRRRAKQLDARGTRIRHKIGVILGKRSTDWNHCWEAVRQ